MQKIHGEKTLKYKIKTKSDPQVYTTLPHFPPTNSSPGSNKSFGFFFLKLR